MKKLVSSQPTMQTFLQSHGGNAVIVTLTRETLLRLTLYSIDGKALIHYYEKMNAG